MCVDNQCVEQFYGMFWRDIQLWALWQRRLIFLQHHSLVCNFLQQKFPASNGLRKKGVCNGRKKSCMCHVWVCVALILVLMIVRLSSAWFRHVEVNRCAVITSLPNFRFTFTHLLPIFLRSFLLPIECRMCVSRYRIRHKANFGNSVRGYESTNKIDCITMWCAHLSTRERVCTFVSQSHSMYMLELFDVGLHVSIYMTLLQNMHVLISMKNMKSLFTHAREAH